MNLVKTNKMLSIASGLSMFFMLQGCSSTPVNHPLLTQAESELRQAEGDTLVNRYSALELKKAQEEIAMANKLKSDEDNAQAVKHHAYLARQHVLIARERAQTEMLKQSIDEASAQRNKILLEDRNQKLEATKARLSRQTAQAKQAMAESESASMRAQELEKTISELKTNQTDRGLVLTLNNVLFSTNEHNLKPGATRTLDKIANFLNQHPSRAVLIEGFTDSTGEEDYNNWLSQKRAEAVRRSLIEFGVDERQISAKGYGENYPAASNNSSAGRQQNRRVEIVVSNADGVRPAARQ